MAAVAYFSGLNARGIVCTDGKTYIIEVEKMYEPEDAAGVHLGMWMQGPHDHQEMEAGEYPFREVYDKMKEATDKASKELDDLYNDGMKNPRRS